MPPQAGQDKYFLYVMSHTLVLLLGNVQSSKQGIWKGNLNDVTRCHRDAALRTWKLYSLEVPVQFFFSCLQRASVITKQFNNCPTRCVLFRLLHFCRQLYMFRVLTPIIKSSYNCNYSFWYWFTGSTTIHSRCWVGTDSCVSYGRYSFVIRVCYARTRVCIKKA